MIRDGGTEEGKLITRPDPRSMTRVPPAGRSALARSVISQPASNSVRSQPRLGSPGGAPQTWKAIAAAWSWVINALGPGGLVGGHGEELGRVGLAELRVLEAGQHPRQLADAGLVVQADHAGAGDRSVAGLGHDQVVVGERGDLGQVGDDDDLGEPGE